MNVETLRELFVYNDWGRDRLMRLAVELSDAQLDRPFEMGAGTLRQTLWHMFKWEWMWLRRWQGQSPKSDECPRDFPTMQDLREQWRQTAEQRDCFLGQLRDNQIHQSVIFTNDQDKAYTFRLADMIVHVCNHGTHHRAQALNMLRHLAIKPPPMDFLDMIYERQTHEKH